MMVKDARVEAEVLAVTLDDNDKGGIGSALNQCMRRYSSNSSVLFVPCPWSVEEHSCVDKAAPAAEDDDAPPPPPGGGGSPRPFDRFGSRSSSPHSGDADPKVRS